MSSGFLLSFLGAWTGLSLYILGGFGNARTARPALFAAGIGMFLSSIRTDGLPLVWPILSGWEWLLAASLLWLGVQLLKVSGRTRLGPIFPLLASIVFAIPAWTTRDEASLLVGHIPITFPQGVGVLAAISLVGGGWRWLRSSPVGLRVSRGLMVYGLLGLGTLVFSIPFFWLLLTSFKEERDMTNANGLVWVPRVTRTMQAFDPLSPLYETTYQGMPVQVEKRATEPGGIRVSVVRPGSVAGTSLVVPDSALKEVPREMKVVRTRDAQGEMEGLLLDEDGAGAHVKILEPASRAGQIVVMPTQAVEPVRDVGLLWRNYSDALAALPAEAEGGWRYLRNTLFLCVMCVLGTVLSCTVVAYGFARLRFPGRNFLFGVLLATMMLPGAVTMLPSFLIFRELGWVDSLTPLWAPAFLGSAFNIFLLRQFFLTLPRELEDAAKIDGCGYGRTLWSVMAPQIKPALVVVAIWTFIGAWNNFMGPLIYVNSSEKMTIAYAMQLFAGDKSNQPGLLMAFATMALLPIVILFFLAQRAFVEGIALTGRTG